MGLIVEEYIAMLFTLQHQILKCFNLVVAGEQEC
jgi:hypothetical protein